MSRLWVFLVVTLAASPALAAATPWQELTPGVRARLISADTVSGGKTLAGLEIEMPASTKTYWRIPGETGIPTEIDFSASSGVSGATILWPFPEVDRSDGYLDYVYHGPVVLPFELEIGAGATVIDTAVTMGICDEVCVPAMASFSLKLGENPDAAQAIRLQQAVATSPIAWDQSGQPFGTVRLAPSGTGLLLSDPAPGIDPAQLIAESGDPALLFGMPQKSPDTAIWQLPLLGGANGTALAGRPVQLTFMTPAGPYWVMRDIAPALN